jgi:hypothetical protein
MGSAGRRLTVRRLIPTSGYRGDKWVFIFRIAVVSGGLVLLLLAYELGQMRAGHNRLMAGQRYGELKMVLTEAQDTNRELRDKIAILETNEKVKAEGYRRVEDRLAELQTKILAQQEDLAFYRGIVSSDQQSGLRIQDFDLTLSPDKKSYVLRLVLAQALRNDRQVSGKVDLSVEGIRDGESVTLDLEELSGGSQRKDPLSFSFKYFQSLQAYMVLPDGFAPNRVIVKLIPKSKSDKAIEKIFEWSAQPG